MKKRKRKNIMTYYELLEVVPTASFEVIRAAYIAQAKKYHPDVCNNSFQSEEKIRLLNEAYSVLSDPNKRRIYDDSLLQMKKTYRDGEILRRTKATHHKNTATCHKNTIKSNKSVTITKKHNIATFVSLICIVLVCIIAFIPMVSSFVSKISEDPVHESTETNQPTVQPEPLSGQILSKKTYISDVYHSSITVKADDSSSVVVKLKDVNNNTVLSFYVRAGKSAIVDVPQIKLQVYFASGKKWYGEEKLFGKDTVYSKDDDYLDFREYTWEYTLSPTYNGNFKQTPSDSTEFKD